MKKEEEYIVSNQIRCKHCDDTPFSTHRHAFASCKCRKVAVDGGQVYLRRAYPGGLPSEHYDELSITMKLADVEAIVSEVMQSRESGRNDLGVALAAIRAMRDVGLLKEEVWGD